MSHCPINGSDCLKGNCTFWDESPGKNRPTCIAVSLAQSVGFLSWNLKKLVDNTENLTENIDTLNKHLFGIHAHMIDEAQRKKRAKEYKGGWNKPVDDIVSEYEKDVGQPHQT